MAAISINNIVLRPEESLLEQTIHTDDKQTNNSVQNSTTSPTYLYVIFLSRFLKYDIQ